MCFKYKRWYRSFLIRCISVMIVTIISLIYINYKLRPLILDIAEIKITQYVNEAMSLAVHHTINQDLSSDDLLEFQYDQTGRVVSYNINL